MKKPAVPEFELTETEEKTRGLILTLPMFDLRNFHKIKIIYRHRITSYNVCYTKLLRLYGGSCKASNAKELFANKDVDGGLIGGASLKAEDFIGIINGF